MATRFGRSHWQDVDRLNLMKVCLKHQQWDDRLREMRAIYTKCPPGYFTENSCRDELERIIALPTPNVRVDVSSTFSYSRKIMMTKWIEHFEAEISKNQKSRAELSMVDLRRNTKLILELWNGETPDRRVDEIISMVHQNAEVRKNDANYKRLIGSLDTAMVDVLERNVTLGLDLLDLPPTKEPDADMETGTRGYLSPLASAHEYDMSFFSPPRPMRTLAEALREAVPIAEPDIDFDFDPASPRPMIEEMPDDILEPETPMEGSDEVAAQEDIKEEEEDVDEIVSSPKTSPKKHVSPRKSNPIESPKKLAALESPENPAALDAPKKRTDSESSSGQGISNNEVVSDTLEVRDSPDSVEEQETFEPEEPEPTKKEATPSSPKKQVLPASPKKHAPAPSSKPINQPTSPVKSSLRSAAKRREPSPLKVDVDDIKKEESTPSPQPSGPSSSEQVAPSPPVPRTRGRPRLSSSASSTAKKNEEMADVKEETPDPPTSARRRAQEPSTSVSTRKTRGGRKFHEDSPAPPLSRTESTIDLEPPSPYDALTAEVEVQTDITIREAVQSISMGERRRFHAMPAAPPRKGRRSLAPGDTPRSESRASSVSTQGPRGGSVPKNPPKNAVAQTTHFEMNKDDLVVLRVDPISKVLVPFADFSSEQCALNLETCKEIEIESTDKGNEEEEPANKEDGDREVTIIVEASKPAAKYLIAERGFKLASNTSDSATTPGEYSPIKRRREDRAREEKMKNDLLLSHRKVYDHAQADAFRRPVPSFEEEYGLGILERIDLSMIKREIESGEVNNPTKLFLRIYRMLSNAVMFNGFDHEVHLAAKFIQKEVMVDLINAYNEERMPKTPVDGTRSGSSSVERDGPSGTPSMEREPISLRGDGSTRVISRRSQQRDSSMTASGNRRPKRNIKPTN